MEVHVVIGTAGDFSDRVEWVAAVFTDRTRAESEAETRLHASKAFQIAYHSWCDSARRMGFKNPASPEMQPLVAARLGPMPRGKWVDDYTVVTATVDSWEAQ